MPSTKNGKVILWSSFHIFNTLLNVSMMGVIVPRYQVVLAGSTSTRKLDGQDYFTEVKCFNGTETINS
jgi:hypothetical protein